MLDSFIRPEIQASSNKIVNELDSFRVGYTELYLGADPGGGFYWVKMPPPPSLWQVENARYAALIPYFILHFYFHISKSSGVVYKGTRQLFLGVI